MNRNLRAFTLIELLVVIAIIAILAAILFPVFAQAKQAAKNTTAISNMKQIGTSVHIYVSDYDDTTPPRRVHDGLFFNPDGGANFSNVTKTHSWKQMLHPYTKNADIFRDSSNPAARYPDDVSDPIQNPLLTADQPRHPRGYVMYGLLGFLYSGSDFKGANMTAVDEAARGLMIFETKTRWVDLGAYIEWSNDPNHWSVSELPNVPSGGNPNWGGKKWEDKAFVATFFDSHAARTNIRSTCGTAGSTQRNMWHVVPAEEEARSRTWIYDALCNGLPAGY